MRNRLLLAAGTVAVFVPAMLLAQRPAAHPMMMQSAGPHLEQMWELSGGVGVMGVSKGISGTGSTAIMPGGRLSLGYNINSMWNVSVGIDGGFGKSRVTNLTAYGFPFVAATWTPDINQPTSPFVTAGVGLMWQKNPSNTAAGVQVGVGVRHILQDNLALRVEGDLQYIPKFNGISTTAAGEATVGLSYFFGAKKVPTTVRVAPAVATLTSLKATQNLAAAVLDQRGNPMTGQVVTWRSSNPAVASVSQTGTVTAAGNGSATITASSAAVSGSAAVTVAQAAATVSVSPTTASLNALGATQQLTATASDANRNAFPDASFTWTSSDPTVASVSSSGVVTAVGNGTAQVSATANGHSATATVTVAQTTASVVVTPATTSFSAARATAQLTAQANDANGNAISGKTFTWTSDAPGVATVSDAGLVTAVANGAARVTASADGVSGVATVTVLIAARGAPPVALPALPEMNKAIVMPHVTFAAGRAVLTPEARTALDRFAIAMQTVPNARWQIAGYTDNTGSRAVNLRLSRERAQSVKDYLVDKGVSAASMTVVGYGPANPIATNRTARGRAENRRIEVKRLQ